jgi:arginyl-tRNA synthetase
VQYFKEVSANLCALSNMQPILESKKEIVKQLKKAIGKGFIVTADDLETPPNTAMGDFAFPCFKLAKEQKRSPMEIATELAAKIGPTKLVESINSAGPYVNFKLSSAALGDLIFAALKDKKIAYGTTQAGEGKKVLVEYAQPNTHKEFHIGHVRNGLLGQATVNILRANGYGVVAASYIGDIGAHVAKALWGLQKFHAGEVFAKEDRAKKLGEIYAAASAALDANPEVKKEIDELQHKLEGGDKELRALWSETREWSLDEFKEIFKELKIKPDVWYYESEVEEDGKEMVKTLLTQGIARKSEGATIVDLEDEGLGVFLILKSDGSSLYATKDLALALRKEKEHGADRQIFVVDVRQSLYFKQLFATLKRIGFKATLNHVSYDMVTLPDGAMSSRKGNVVTYKELRDELRGALQAETAKRHEDWKPGKVEETSRALADSALAFFMLRQNPQTIITFDKDEAMSFEGFTGPYALYTNARLHRLIEKAPVKPAQNTKLLTHPLEGGIIKLLANYPEVIYKAGVDFDPSHIAHWLFDISKAFAEYYHEVRILDADSDKKVMQARLGLAQAIIQTIEHACGILGMEAVKEM